MSYKTEKVFKTLKKNIIIYLILWLIIAIVLIAPVTYTFVNTNKNGKLNTGGFIEQIGPAILDFTTITEMFNEKYVKSFMQTMGVYTLGYAIIIGYSISKVLPKSEYDKKEHGSSDWCLEGEQYKILSKKSGLILAKDNYLPLSKRGNLNVLIVGRIRYW